jgi:heme/copper-type cytochrome/quinol oxidase subunit 1
MTETEWLTQSWRGRPGLIGWLTEVDHKRIATRYILTAVGFFVPAGVLALLVRLQLAGPDHHLLGPATYNAFFTMHGTAMMFLFAVPVMQGMGLYLVPLMIGTRNVAFPRLNLFGYYTFLFGGCFLFAGLLMRTAPQAGWFSYVPLASLRFAPEKGVDIWAQTISFTELVAATLLTFGAIALRGLELAHANVWWDTNAYGSIVWTILGAHASHLIASALEDVLLCALVFFGAMEPKHFVSITVSAIYSYFVAAVWLPLYLLLYWLPRP